MHELSVAGAVLGTALPHAEGRPVFHRKLEVRDDAPSRVTLR